MNKIVYIGESNNYFTNNKIYEISSEGFKEYLLHNDNNGYVSYVSKNYCLSLEKWREMRINKILENE